VGAQAIESELAPNAAPGQLPVTVVIPARSEERNLPDALESVHWATRVIVVDSRSPDHTADIARRAGAEVVQFDHASSGPKKKAWALRELDFRTDWVLFLDADERVTPALAAEIATAITDEDADAFYIDREFVFMGRSLRCFRPNWNLRLFRPGLTSIEDLGLNDLPRTGDNEIHEHFVCAGRSRFLREPLLHDDDRGVTAWLERHNRYATWEAELYLRLRTEPVGVGVAGFLRLDPFQRKRVLRRVWVRLPFRPAVRFFVWYVLRRGFLDGRAGLVFCRLMSYYEFIIGLKLRELGDG
jgi:glycosyltransferase involved in cell wall biosynthesis